MHPVTMVPVATSTQIRLVADLAYRIWHEHFPPIIGQETTDYLVEHFQSAPAIAKQIADEGLEYFLLELDEELVGYAATQKEADALFISKLYVEKCHRGQGIGSDVFAQLEEKGKAEGLQKIWLKCNRDNASSLDVYAHKGFNQIAVTVEELEEGIVRDDIILEKKLI